MTSIEHEVIDRNLRNALALATDARATYVSAPDSVRRQLNQALFSRIYVYSDGHVTSELAEPFDILLGEDLRTLAANPRDPQEVDWTALEDSWNEEGAHDEVGAFQIDRPSRGRGLNYATMVAPGGIEPPRADSKSAALSAELRGRAEQGYPRGRGAGARRPGFRGAAPCPHGPAYCFEQSAQAPCSTRSCAATRAPRLLPTRSSSASSCSSSKATTRPQSSHTR